MAKKKAEPKKEDNDIAEEDLVDDEEVESHYPDLSDNSKSKEESVTIDVVDDEEEEEEDEGYEIEPEELPTYKFLTLALNKGFRDDDYTLSVEGQSHGFCNIYVQHLLETEGVNSAAYKITRLVPPEIFIRLEDGYEIKKILYKAIEKLRAEVGKVEKLFKKLM
ncbi:MAG: RpoL/Rpb11 RNA polymerase subunit family protein [Promethearchaeota archaeon]